jgi:hypothetical protein
MNMAVPEYIRIEEVDSGQMLPPDAAGVVSIHPAHPAAFNFYPIRVEGDSPQVPLEAQWACGYRRQVWHDRLTAATQRRTLSRQLLSACCAVTSRLPLAAGGRGVAGIGPRHRNHSLNAAICTLCYPGALYASAVADTRLRCRNADRADLE